MENLKIRNETLCIVHANFFWGNGGKMNKLVEFGYWLAVKEGRQKWTNKCNELK
jgi:hypothetical protein